MMKMKKIFSILTLACLSFLVVEAQSGGTSFERAFERLTDKVERLAEKVEDQAEITAENWESRSARISAKAERFGGRFEDKWDDDWSVRFEGWGNNLYFTSCPEVSFLGIQTLEVSIEKAKKLGFDNRYGSYVSKVMAKSSAEEAGLQAFDYIYGVDEQRTSDNQNLSDILEDYEPGDEVTLHLMRKGEKMSVKVKLARYEHDFDSDVNHHAFLGVSPQDFETEEIDGVPVEIVEKSTAEEMGLKVGDVITSINGFPILDWDDVTTAVQNTKPGETIEVNFQRGENNLSAKGTVKSYEDVYPENQNGSWNLDIDWDEMGSVDVAIADDWDQQVEQDENRAFIGIYTEMLSSEKAKKLGYDNPFGAYVTGVLPNSGAEKAGIMPFDYIYGFDEYRAAEGQHLGIILNKFKPGQTATAHFMRKGKPAKASITFTKPFIADKKEQNSCEDPFFGIIQIDSDGDKGVMVSPVGGSTAKELGLQEGDVITHINGYQMVDWQDVTAAIDMLNPGQTISVDYIRDGKTMKGSKSIKSYAETKNCADCDCGGKPTVVIATTPSPSTGGRGWPQLPSVTSTAPRVSIENVKPSFGTITTEESSALRSKGVQLSETNTLTVDNLRLSTNTSTGLFDLDFNLPSSGNTVVRIYNLAGRVLYEYDLGSFSGKFSDSVDISQNGVGNYFLEINQNGKVFTKKITLTRD